MPLRCSPEEALKSTAQAWLSRRAAAVLAAALLLALALPAAARHHAGRAPAVHSSGATPGVFDYYLLSLSWSPTYCLTHAGDRNECGDRGYGLILHGLWPQFEHGGYPQDCNAAPLDAGARRLGATLFPGESLLRHEWQRHGSCSGLDAGEYLRTADRALARVVVPPELAAPGHELHLTAAELAARLRAVNPGLPATGLRIACSRTALSEIRLCLDRTLGFRACGDGVGGRCPAGALRIPATR
jgi:ribonuclease T2